MSQSYRSMVLRVWGGGASTSQRGVACGASVSEVPRPLHRVLREHERTHPRSTPSGLGGRDGGREGKAYSCKMHFSWREDTFQLMPTHHHGSVDAGATEGCCVVLELSAPDHAPTSSQTGAAVAGPDAASCNAACSPHPPPGGGRLFTRVTVGGGEVRGGVRRRGVE